MKRRIFLSASRIAVSPLHRKVSPTTGQPLLCVSQFTTNDMAGQNVNTGPPLRATNSCPSIRNFAVITVPFAPGPASP